MTDIYNSITCILIADGIETYIELGVICLLFGFTFCSLLSLISYGIGKAINLVNIKAY